MGRSFGKMCKWEIFGRKKFVQKNQEISIEVHVLPHAQRSDVDAFRRNMKTEEMSQVLKKHEDNLLATFKKYAQAELSHGVQSTFGDVSKGYH